MKIWTKMRGLFQRGKRDADMAEEMRLHVELQVELNVKAGMNPDDARYAALRQFGNVASIQERARDGRGWAWLEQFLQDGRFAVRSMRTSLGFTTVAVITLALGIGSCTAIFSIVNATLLRPLDYFEPDRIVVIKELTPPPAVREGVVSPRNFLDWEKRTSSFTALAAYANDSFNFTGRGEPQQLVGVKITARYLDVFGLHPVLGRGFLAAEDSPQGDRVALIGFSFWQQTFGAAPDVVGRTLQLDGEVFTIVGVMPAMPGRTDVWLPMAFTAAQTTEENRGARWLNVAGRLKTGVSVERADAEVKLLAGRIAGADPVRKDWSASVVGLQEYSVRGGKMPLLLLLGAVGCVLLIACANVSSLLLARATARRQEISIRIALGAGRGRLIRQLLTESLLLAGLGGIAGVFLAQWGLQAAVIYGPPRLVAPGLDVRVLGFVLAISVVAGLVFGLAPAWLSARDRVGEVLKRGSRGNTDGGARRLRGSLMVGEIAITVMLLSLAGLLGRSFLALAQTSPGFNPEHALVMRLTLPNKKYPLPEQQAAFTVALLAQLRPLPGVLAAGVSHVMPLLSNQANGFLIQGRPEPAQMPITGYFAVTPGYFPAMGIRLLQGRLFNEQDDARGPHVAIINEAMARQHFPEGNALGQRINFGDDANNWREIVGIVSDVAQNAIDRTVPVQSYEPYAQQPRSSLNVVIRFSTPQEEAAGIATLTGLLRPAVYAVDKEQPVGNIASLDEILAGGLARTQFTVLLLAVFSVIALIIAAVGLYGVMAYTVTQRQGEFGIRLALGARPADVLRLVLAQGGKLVGLGLVLGLAGAIAGARIVGSMLFKTSAHDPVTMGGIILLLAVVALLACWLPARRAAKVDPVVALRAE